MTIENVGFPVRNPMLAAGQLDAVTGFSFSVFVNLKDKGVPVDDITVLLMADHGVNLYGHAIVVNTKFAAAHPDAVKSFLRAFVKGLKEAVKSPVTAVEPVLKRNDLAKKDLEVERLNMAIRDNIVTPEVKANGYGGIDRARFAGAIDQIVLTYKFKTAKPKSEDIFDASYLPLSRRPQSKLADAYIRPRYSPGAPPQRRRAILPRRRAHRATQRQFRWPVAHR